MITQRTKVVGPGYAPLNALVPDIWETLTMKRFLSYVLVALQVVIMGLFFDFHKKFVSRALDIAPTAPDEKHVMMYQDHARVVYLSSWQYSRVCYELFVFFAIVIVLSLPLYLLLYSRYKLR